MDLRRPGGNSFTQGAKEKCPDQSRRGGFTLNRDSAINNTMSTQELINKEVEALPEPLQREVYDFARFLRLKSTGELQLGQEFESWEAASDEDWLKLEPSLTEAQ